MKIDIAVHGRFHAFDLANQLHRQGSVGSATYPGLSEKFMPPNAAVVFPHFEVAATVPGSGLPMPVRRATAAIRGCPKPGPFVVDVSWVELGDAESIPVARSRRRVVIERGSTHVVHQTEVLRVAYDEIGQPFLTRPGNRRPGNAGYDLADAIAVPSTIAAESFIRGGIPEELGLATRSGS